MAEAAMQDRPSTSAPAWEAVERALTGSDAAALVPACNTCARCWTAAAPPR
jgi:hypothetical protein